MKKILALLAILTLAVSPALFASSFNDNAVATAVALAANGTNCSVGEAAGGVDASGNAEACFAPTTVEVDPTVDTSAEIVAIIGAGVYSPAGALTVEVDGDTSNEINTVTADDTNTTTGLVLTVAGGGINATTVAGDTVTVTGTEVDSVVGAITGVVVADGAGNISAAANLTDVVYLTAEVDGSVSNEINTVTGDDTNTTTGLGITLAGAGINATTVVGNTVTITGTEVDPQVGTLTDTKWCTTNGTVIACTSDAPAGLIGITDSGTPYNTALGEYAGAGIAAGMVNNTFIGVHAASGGSMDQWADNNVAVGYYAMGGAVRPSLSVAVGNNAAKVVTYGYQITAIGQDSQIASTTAQESTSVGAYSLEANTTGNKNTAVGDKSLGSLTGAYHSNSALGQQAGRYKNDGYTSATSLSQGVYIGAESRAADAASANEIVIGYQALGKGSNTASIGNSSVTSLHLGTKVVSAPAAPVTLAAAATTFAVTAPVTVVTGDGDGNTIATITGGYSGQTITLVFVDTNVTITDTDAATANTVNLNAAFTSAANSTLTLVNNGTKWLETARSVNG